MTSRRKRTKKSLYTFMTLLDLAIAARPFYSEFFGNNTATELARYLGSEDMDAFQACLYRAEENCVPANKENFWECLNLIRLNWTNPDLWNALAKEGESKGDEQ